MSGNEHDPASEVLPAEPIHRITRPLSRFMHVEAASGALLLACASLAVGLANSPVSDEFLAFWEMDFSMSLGQLQMSHSLKHWVNDGLMAIFFFVIGLEVKEELVHGELRELRRAALPIVAALGGMLVPAGIYLVLQWSGNGRQGWGVPMATDIAFVVGCLALLGKRTPGGLRVLLLTLAIVDDIGAIMVIALGYTHGLQLWWLLAGLAGIGVVVAMQYTGVRSIGMYALVGGLIWLGFHESGVHATIAGVSLGLLTPARAYLDRGAVADFFRRTSDILHGGGWNRQEDRAERVRTFRRVARETIPPLDYLIHVLHPWVALLIMPVFALANAGIRYEPGDLFSPVAIAVMAGLALGKPCGILLLSWISVKLGFAKMPDELNWWHLVGGGCLAGIGFTMALFINNLAFEKPELVQSGKMGIFAGSLISAIAGTSVLIWASRRTES